MSFKQIFAPLMMIMTVILVGSMATAADMPDRVLINSMSEMFEAVEFDHTMHSELGEDCSACHHHTTGTGTTDARCVSCHASSNEVATVGCSGCHVEDPFSSEHLNQKSLAYYTFHIDRPGLKAAYHWNCLGCHEEMDGPTECVDCHARTAKGDAFYQVNATGSPSESGH